MNSEKCVDAVLDVALKWADAAEVLYEEAESSSVDFESNKLRYVHTVQTRGVGLRVIRDGRIGFSSTTDLSKPDRLVASALESAQFGQEAKFQLPSAAQMPSVAVFDPHVVAHPVERCVAMGRAAIERALAANPDYDCGLEMGKTVGRRRLLNSAGLDVTHEFTAFGVGLQVLLVKDRGMIWIGEEEDSRRLCGDLDRLVERILRHMKLAEREVSIETGVLPVVFTPKAVASVLAPFEAALNGKLVQKGASPLTGRLGEKIVDERITVWDDGTVDFAAGSAPCDSEGLPTHRTPLIKRGVLKNYVFDLQTAGLMGRASTGNAVRSFAAQPAPGYTNVVIATGDMPLDAMIKDMKRGLLVDQVLGDTQSNILAGEFALNLDLGFLLENGEIVGRVKDCMIAGNAFDAFNRLVALGDQAEWHGSLRTPAIYFETLNVAGTA